MNRIFAILLTVVVVVVCSCSRPATPPSSAAGEFVDELVIRTTPVKHQGRSSFCWIYGMLATIESDRLMLGDSVNISVDFLARRLLEDEARRVYFDRQGGEILLRGMCSRTLALLEQYGAMPWDTYHYGVENKDFVGANYTVMARKAARMARASKSLSMLQERLGALLDEEIGFLPRVAFMYGVDYTPMQFAHSVCLPGDYEALTSFSHAPFGRRMVVESPDNVLRDSFLNVPLDTMMARIDSALSSGHAVCWEGDISEKGFHWSEGKAMLQNEQQPVDQARRQQAYEHRLTTDDHVMEICGTARDAKGRRYYKMKNSWGTANRYKGYIYVSQNYVRQKTIAVFMRKQGG